MNDQIAEPFLDWLERDDPISDPARPHITYHPQMTQGSEEWLRARIGLLTASEMNLVLTPTLKVANNDKVRQHVYEIAAQRITDYCEPQYVNDDMLRGITDEFEAKIIYNEHVAPLTECGFVTNNGFGFTIGYSPDALVGDDGLIEVKSRRQKYQIQTIAEHVAGGTIPTEYMLQCQTGLLVTDRDWIDFISYSGGLPMCIIRVWPDDEIQAAILEVAQEFEDKVAQTIALYRAAEESDARMFPTERKEREEMIL